MSNPLQPPPPPPPTPESSPAPPGVLNLASRPQRFVAVFVEGCISLFVSIGTLIFSVVVLFFAALSTLGDEEGWADYDSEESFEAFAGIIDPFAELFEVDRWTASVVLLGAAIFLVPWLIWSVLAWRRSTTPCKQMLGLKVVDVRTGEPASTGKMMTRELGGKLFHPYVGVAVFVWLFGPVGTYIYLGYFLVSAVLIVAGRNRQGIWDYLAGTTVIRAK